MGRKRRRVRRRRSAEAIAVQQVQQQAIQRALQTDHEPTSQQPGLHQVLQLQQSVGNQAVQRMMATGTVQREWKRGVMPANQLPLGPIKPDKVDFTFGFKNAKKLKKGKKTVDKLRKNVDNLRDPSLLETSTVTDPSTISQGANSATSALQAGDIVGAQAGFNQMLSFFTQWLKPVMVIVKVVKAIKKLISSIKIFKYLRDKKKQIKNKGQDSLTSDEQATMEAVSYSYGKIKRRLATAVYKTVDAALGAGIYVARFFAVGPGLIVTESLSLLKNAAKAFYTLYRSGKAIYKHVKNTKGVNRQFHGNNLMQAAFRGDFDAAEMLLNFKIGKSKSLKKKVKKLGKDAPISKTLGIPKTPREVIIYLRKLAQEPQEVIDKVALSVKDAMKSQ